MAPSSRSDSVSIHPLIEDQEGPIALEPNPLFGVPSVALHRRGLKSQPGGVEGRTVAVTRPEPLVKRNGEAHLRPLGGL